jgi:beta-barrel assembly-enhancing protease
MANLRSKSATRFNWARTAVSSLCLLGALSSPIARSQSSIQLPNFGDASGSVFSSADEQRLGEAFLREVRANTDTLDDPEVEAYVSSLGFSLVSASDNPGRAFTFFVIANDNVNAFAGPNGVIGVNTGLIMAVESESELAAVLAHEVAHVTQQHIARGIELNDRYSIPAMAGLLAALILSTQNSQAGGAATAAVLGAQVQNQVDFIRANEYEADRVGIGILMRAKYDPRAMAGFFARLQESSRYYRSPPEFLSTHPVTSSRIAEGRARAAKLPYKQYSDSAAFFRVKARVEVLTNGAKKTLPVFNKRLAEGIGGSRNANIYGKALALMELGRYAEAQPLLAKLIAAESGSIPYQDAYARSHLALGGSAAAIAIYQSFLRVYLNDRQMTIGLAEALLKSKRPRDAIRTLERYLRAHPNDAFSYKLLARSYETEGQTAASLAALGEHHYLNGGFRQALFQMERAQRLPNDDFYLASRISARVKELRKESAERNKN